MSKFHTYLHPVAYVLVEVTAEDYHDDNLHPCNTHDDHNDLWQCEIKLYSVKFSVLCIKLHSLNDHTQR